MFHDIAGHEDLTERIIGCGIHVHDAFGPGLLESVYDESFEIELQHSGMLCDATRRVPLTYRGQQLVSVFCPDLVVEGIVIVEIKAVEKLAPIHKIQLQTYLKLSGLPVGLLMNFNVPQLRQGIRRVVRPDLYVKR